MLQVSAPSLVRVAGETPVCFHIHLYHCHKTVSKIWLQQFIYRWVDRIGDVECYLSLVPPNSLNQNIHLTLVKLVGCLPTFPQVPQIGTKIGTIVFGCSLSCLLDSWSIRL